MLSLKSASPRRWLDQVLPDVPTLLIDHAHCEKKAAGTALNLIFAYVDRVELCREMADIVDEELSHFRMVLDLLERRGIRFRRLAPGSYGRQLNELVRKQEPQKAIDRLLVASLIEARSCERFGLLREHLPDRELASFYDGLFESEARHHSTYVRLANRFGPEEAVRSRLENLATAEAELIARGDELPRMHS
ncbi:MAG TPA: tRNA-(ms[2]io[6]A)-hydroxylase [Pirellulales bacterium]|jgi:tRNA-(ms[2]io[6]A)-hydroxylase|nr:tRNA-(ms[2]io[6]A)-hydroxylase [Pirellulales bacterium]